jgi:hypothetical protein
MVNGIEYAVLRNESEANIVRDRLHAPYRNENTVESEFVENWEYRERLADQDDLGTIEDTLLRLDKRTRGFEEYVVQRGDTLGAIAIRNNMALNKIRNDNPHITSDLIRPGDVVNIETTRPYLSVRTVDHVTRTEPIPPDTEERENPLEHVNHTLTLVEGREGERETTVRIVRVNGIQMGPEETIASRVTINPINRVVEVGTSEVQPIRR